MALALGAALRTRSLLARVHVHFFLVTPHPSPHRLVMFDKIQSELVPKLFPHAFARRRPPTSACPSARPPRWPALMACPVCMRLRIGWAPSALGYGWVGEVRWGEVG